MESMTARQVRINTLTLHRPTVVDRLQQSVQVPRGAVPKNGLPFWTKVPLASKLPVIDHPKDAFVFYRDKLGQTLWKPSPVGEFLLDDPYMREVDYTYEAVHDPALQRMFSAGEHRRTLINRGFILPTGEAVCSLRQFNTYRRYLQTIYRGLIRKEYRRRAVDLSDEQTIRRARRCEQQQLEADRHRLEREQKQGELRHHLEELREQKQQQLVVRQLRYAEMLRRVEASKAEQRRLASDRSREMDERAAVRQAVAAEIQRAKVIATVQAWNREEKERKARMEAQEKQLQEYKEKEVERQWKSKIQYQQEREELEERLLARQEEALRLAVELRNKTVEREDLRMQALLKQIKADREKERVKRLRLRPAQRSRSGRHKTDKANRANRVKADDPRRRRRVTSAAFIVDEGSMTPTDRMFNVAMHVVKSGREQGAGGLVADNLWKAFTDTGFDPNEKRDGVPEAVAVAIDFLFDSVMEGIVHRMVMQTLKCVYHKVLERCFALLEDLPAREMARRGWVCNHGMMQHSELRERARAREKRDCKEAASSTTVGEDDDGEGVEQHTPRKKRSTTRGRSPEGRTSGTSGTSEDERQRILRQIEVLDRKNQQLKQALEQPVSPTVSAVDAGEPTPTDLDANFGVLARKLQRRMVAIAAQSVSEETKLTTQHRWNVMKEVELFELVDRLCSMMMTSPPKQFLKSSEFQWAADILARDVMREVRHQVRQNNRKRERERGRRAKRDANERAQTDRQRRTSRSTKEKEVSYATGIPAQQRRATRSEGEGGVSACPTVASLEATLEPLDESKVPLLRLHKRSPHQPSIHSLDFHK